MAKKANSNNSKKAKSKSKKNTADKTDVIQAYIDEARTHKGEDGSWTWKTSGLSRGEAWCCAFVVAVARTVGGIVNKVMPDGIYLCSTFVQDGVKRKLGTWLPGPVHGEYPQPLPGDIITYRYRVREYVNQYDNSHVGIVIKATKDKVYTVEGNTGGSGSISNTVHEYVSDLKKSSINGYYRPNWEDIRLL